MSKHEYIALEDNCIGIVLKCGAIAVIDAEDFEKVVDKAWRRRQYAKGGTDVTASSTKSPRNIRLHRLVMNAPPGLMVDHKDGDTLNNRKSNLRLCTNAQNQYNQRPRGGSSEYKGVSWYKKSNKWVVRIRKSGQRLTGGYYGSEIEAAKAYDSLAYELYGEFAYLNFPNAVLPQPPQE